MDTDRNLLLGVLALEADLIDSEQFARACRSWKIRPEQSLAEVLEKHGWLSANSRTALEMRLTEHCPPQSGDSSTISYTFRRQQESTHHHEAAETDLFPNRKRIETTAAPIPSQAAARFTILNVHSRGGLGQISLARDEQLQRIVALKEIRPERRDDPQAHARFQTEAVITGQLEHPGVVPIYALAANGRSEPYYVMRFIQGQTLADAIAAYHQQPTAMVFRDLLKRFCDVCQTVAYAHSKQVLHRDLKPSNVMLGKFGETLVLDWGLAKSTIRGQESGVGEEKTDTPSPSDLTVVGQVLGTPAYMSPEQAEGASEQIGPATDIYALGAILYVLLTGRPPFQGPGAEVLDQLRQCPPPPPSSVKRDVPRALESICLKAMARSIPRRYASATELARDVERFLADEPVTAFAEPWTTRLVRWERRHKPLVAGVAVLVIAALVTLAAGTYVLKRKQQEILAERNTALQERGRARKSADKAEAINHFLLEELLAEASPDKNPAGSQISVRELLDKAARRIDKSFHDQPELEASIRGTIGKSYYSLGLFDQSEPHFQRALELCEKELGPEDAATLNAANDWALFLIAKGRGAEAEALLRKTLQLCEQALDPEDEATLSTRNNLGYALTVLGRLADAEKVLQPTYETRIRVLGPDHPHTLMNGNNLALVVQGLGRLAEAEPLMRRVLEGMKAQRGEDHPDTLTAQNNLGHVLTGLGKLAAAEPLFQTTLAARRQVLGQHHPHTLVTASNLALTLQGLGRLAEAERQMREILDLIRAQGEDHPDVLTVENNLGNVLSVQGKNSEAEPFFRHAYEARRRVLGPEHQHTMVSQNNLALLLQGLGQIAEAEKLMREFIETSERTAGPDHPNTLTGRHNLAFLHHVQGRLSEAESDYRKTLDKRLRVLGPEHPDTLGTRNNLASVLRGQGKLSEAEAMFREVLQVRRKLFAATHTHIADSLSGLGRTLAEAGRAEEAEPLLREAVSIQQKALPPGSWRTANTQSILGGCLASRRRYDEAEPLLLQSYEALKTAKGPPPRDVADAVRRIVALYEAWNKMEKAEEWRKEMNEK